MKRSLVILFFSLVVLQACKKDAAEAPEAKSRVSFSVSAFDISSRPFPKMGAQTSALGDTLRNHINYLECVVFDSSENFMFQMFQNQASPDFGKLAMDLKPGTYTLAFIGRSNDGNSEFVYRAPRTFSNLTIVRAFNPGDLFVKTLTLTVTAAPMSQNVRMDRVTGAIELTIQDQIPANAGNISVMVLNEADLFIKTGGISGTYSYQTDFPLSAADKGQSNRKFFLYVINTKSLLNLRIDCTVSGQLYRKTISNIQCYPNEVTRLTGNLFH